MNDIQTFSHKRPIMPQKLVRLHASLQMLLHSPSAAVRHMATSLAVEWAKTGVRVNSLRGDQNSTQFSKQLTDKTRL